MALFSFTGAVHFQEESTYCMSFYLLFLLVQSGGQVGGDLWLWWCPATTWGLLQWRIWATAKFQGYAFTVPPFLYLGILQLSSQGGVSPKGSK